MLFRSDLQSVDGLANDHRIAADLREAGEMALKAGVSVVICLRDGNFKRIGG